MHTDSAKDVFPYYPAMRLATPMKISVGFLVFEKFQILDMTGPLAAFEIANFHLKREKYSLLAISQHGGMVRSSSGVTVATHAVGDYALDTIVIAGGHGAPVVTVDPGHVALIQSLAVRSRRMASVCTGAFLLAGAGLLNGRRATTHWNHTCMLQKTYPEVRVEADPIFIQDGSVWTSAGITAGIDLALALIEEDCGPKICHAVARELVLYHRRQGGQKQFSALLELEAGADRIQKTLLYAREHLAEDLSVTRLAEIAALSERQFRRLFRSETGESPARAIERLRAEVARGDVEQTLLPLEGIGESAGFTSPETMRRAFIRLFGQSPQSLRRASQANRKR
ncbi:MAG: GlxA family transcriptional regulator [Pseudomonas sp.]